MEGNTLGAGSPGGSSISKRWPGDRRSGELMAWKPNFGIAHQLGQLFYREWIK